jgi:hypothetical protein
MRIARGRDIPFVPFSTHRVGRIENKRLLSGREGAPDNYELSLVLIEGEYATPRHRHNFDQVRVMLRGRFGFGRDRVQEEGSVGYFCEGVHYTQEAIGPSLTLLLQGGGASGQGFMSYAQLERAQAELSQSGVFERGVYTTRTADGGRVNKDAYEALWEHAFARRIAYPAPRYDLPVIVDPAAFGWTTEAPGVERQHLGSFGECGLALSYVRLAPGARHAMGRAALAYVVAGEGQAGGQPWGAEDAIATDDDATLTIEATGPTTLFEIALPRFAGTAARPAAA